MKKKKKKKKKTVANKRGKTYAEFIQKYFLHIFLTKFLKLSLNS